MGGERFRFMAMSEELPRPVSDEEKRHYTSTLLPKLISTAKAWWAKQSAAQKKTWEFNASSSQGVLLKQADQSASIVFPSITIPAQLNSTLCIGWQDRRYGSEVDPKKDLAEDLMTEVRSFQLPFLRCDSMDCIAEDLGYAVDDSDCGRSGDLFTPESGMYFTGNGDSVYCVRGESMDLTACDKECGYCGRCMY